MENIPAVFFVSCCAELNRNTAGFHPSSALRVTLIPAAKATRLTHPGTKVPPLSRGALTVPVSQTSLGNPGHGHPKNQKILVP